MSGGKTAIKIILFVILFGVGWVNIGLDYFVELHEIGHMKAYQEDGIRAWRINKYKVGSSRYSINGLMGGHREVFRALLLVYAAMFIFVFRQFWILGPVMGLMARAFHHPWEGTDFTKITKWSDRMFGTWISEEGLWLGIAIGAFIALKLIPEFYELATGKKLSLFGSSHPYKKEPTALP